MTSAELAALRDDLHRDEGTGPMRKGRFFPYRCTAGKLTIGCGRNLDDVGISARTRDQMLDEDIDECLTDLRSFPWFLTLDGARQRALVNMRFNLGPNRFRGFPKFLAAMSRRDYAGAKAELLNSAWATQVPARAMRIMRLVETGTE